LKELAEVVVAVVVNIAAVNHQLRGVDQVVVVVHGHIHH
jgi:hypothetical protein